jgi:hypothetical protein
MYLLPKRFLSAIAILLAAGDAWCAGAGCTSSPRSLQVRIFGDSHVRLGKPVALNVVVENIGRRELKLPVLMEPYWYWLRLEAKNAQGKVVEWRGPELKLIYSDNARVSIDPGYSYGRSFGNLEKDLDFSQPGKYAIRAIWGIGPDGNCRWGKYSSQEFMLYVVP